MSDPSHLMKTTRNNVLHSRAGDTKLLWNQGQFFQWETMISIYEERAKNPECLVDLHKISYQHVFPTTFEKMRVSFAAEILSNSVSVVLRNNGHYEFANFVKAVDHFFDICNSSRNQNNPQKAPIQSIEDSRLTWLENDFINYFLKWQESVEKRKKKNGDEFTKVEKEKMVLSVATREGLMFTAKSLVNITKETMEAGADYVCLRRLSQDVLESFFGHVRCMGRSNRNPNLLDFGYRAHNINFTKNLKKSFV